MKILKGAIFAILVIAFSISCKKEFSYENGNKLSSGTWTFQNSATQYTGNVDTAFIQTTGTTKVLTIKGKSLSGGQIFLINLFTTDSFTVTSYLASLSEAEFNYSTGTKTIFSGDNTVGEFVVNITSLSGNTITGTFSGQVEDSTGAQTLITLGSFTSSIDLSGNGTTGGTSTSIGTLGVSNDSCTPILLSGTYKAGIDFTSSNTLQVQVNVTTPGTFIIASNSVNGVDFFKAGTFTTTGVQNVILDGRGSPQDSGKQNYIVSYGTSTCNFSVTFAMADPPGAGTLGASAGSCTPVTPAGTYTQGVALNSSNTITLQANVTATGSYNITTNIVNGVTFAGSGSFTTTGIQPVMLTGSGTPTNSGAQNFAVTFGTSTCNFSLTFDAPAAPATGTLGGAGGTCTPVTPSGTYTQGTVLNSSNTIDIDVNVATTGPYNITTNPVNGVTFTGTGNFAATGTQTVTLNGSGTPTNAGAQNFSVTFGTSTCNFSITFAAASTAIYSCKIDGVLTNFSDEAGATITDMGVNFLDLDGFSGDPNTTDAPEFEISINKITNTAITAGTYDEKHLVNINGYNIQIYYTDSDGTTWSTTSTVTPPDNPPFTIVVTSVSATRVKGTFSGTLADADGTGTKTITEGVFDLPIQ